MKSLLLPPSEDHEDLLWPQRKQLKVFFYVIILFREKEKLCGIWFLYCYYWEASLSVDCWVACYCLGAKQEDGKYKHTVDLPKTSFGMRANSSTREPELQKIWEDNQVFKRVVSKNTGVGFIPYLGYLLSDMTYWLTFTDLVRKTSFFMMVLHMPMVIFTSAML